MARLDAATPRLIVTPVLLALNTAVFVATVVVGANVLGGRAEDYLRFGANFAPLTTGGEWWRVLGAVFVHFGIVHLAVNLWALWETGRLTEKLYGNARFAAIYFFAGACGSLASMLWKQDVITVGASSAVFGVLGALFAYLARERQSIPAATLDRLRASAGVFVAYSLYHGFAQAGIDNAAHAGGLAGGFVMGLLFARPLSSAARPRGNKLQVFAAAALAAVVLPAAALLVPDTSRVYRQALALQKEAAAFSTEERRLIAVFQEIADRSREGRISNDDALRELRTKVLPAWNAAVAGLARVELDANAPARKDYDLLLRYAVARRDTMKAMADYLESGSPADAMTVAQRRSEAEAALKQYRSQQK